MKSRCFCSQEGIFCAGLLSWPDAVIVGCGTELGRKGGGVCTDLITMDGFHPVDCLPNPNLQSIWPFCQPLKSLQ